MTTNTDLIKSLRDPATVKRWFDQIGDQAADEIQRLETELAAATAECERLRKDAADAARYRWIKANCEYDGSDDDYGEGSLAQAAWDALLLTSTKPEELDAAIDAAMREGGKDEVPILR